MTYTARSLDADTVKAQADARTVARALDVRIASATGDRWSVHCPNGAGHSHGDRTPSAQVYANGWRCFGCGEGGSVLDLVAVVEGLDVQRDFVRVLELTAELAGIVTTTGGPRRRPAARKAPPRPDPPPFDREARNALVTAVWRALGDAPRTDRFEAWMADRAASPSLAHHYGVRDLAAARGEVLGILDNFDLAAAGMLTDKGLWWPLARFRASDDDHAGAVFPCIDPVTGAYGFRWRYYRPPGQAKAMAMPAAGTPLLGVETAEGARVVFIAEGETDWLAVLSALNQIGAPHAGCVGMCVMSAGWRPEWGHLVRGADRVVVVVDRGKLGKDGRTVAARTAAQVADSIARLVGCRASDMAGTERGARVVCVPFEDDDDCADHHKRGELAATLEAWI